MSNRLTFLKIPSWLFVSLKKKYTPSSGIITVYTEQAGPGEIHYLVRLVDNLGFGLEKCWLGWNSACSWESSVRKEMLPEDARRRLQNVLICDLEKARKRAMCKAFRWKMCAAGTLSPSVASVGAANWPEPAACCIVSLFFSALVLDVGLLLHFFSHGGKAHLSVLSHFHNPKLYLRFCHWTVYFVNCCCWWWWWWCFQCLIKFLARSRNWWFYFFYCWCQVL